MNKTKVELSERTIMMLQDVPTGHQVENFVRVSRSDVDDQVRYFPKCGVLWLKDGIAYRLDKPFSLPARGKFFMIF